MSDQSNLSNFGTGDPPQTDQYECSICGRSFDSAKGKGSHMGQKHDDDEMKSALLDELTRLADELGRTPGKRDMNQRGAYSEKSYRNQFGSWNKALREVRLQVNARWDISESDLLDELTRLADELGQTPNKKQMNQLGKYDGTTYMEKFGSWNEALTQAGFKVNESKNIAKPALINELIHLTEELERIPKARDMDQKGKYSAQTYGEKDSVHGTRLSEKQVLRLTNRMAYPNQISSMN